MPLATRIARPRSRVQIEPDNPYGESFARRTASSSVSKGIRQTTGPKISSWATRHALSTLARTAGRRKNPASVGHLAAGDQSRPFLAPIAQIVERRLPLTSEISGPICVASSSGSPTTIASVAAANRSTYSS